MVGAKMPRRVEEVRFAIERERETFASFSDSGGSRRSGLADCDCEVCKEDSEDKGDGVVERENGRRGRGRRRGGELCDGSITSGIRSKKRIKRERCARGEDG